MVKIIFCAATLFAWASTGCNALAENPTASAACVDAGPGSGATDISCSKCCQANGAVGRHSDVAKCVCIGK